MFPDPNKCTTGNLNKRTWVSIKIDIKWFTFSLLANEFSKRKYVEPINLELFKLVLLWIGWLWCDAKFSTIHTYTHRFKSACTFCSISFQCGQFMFLYFTLLHNLLSKSILMLHTFLKGLLFSSRSIGLNTLCLPSHFKENSSSIPRHTDWTLAFYTCWHRFLVNKGILHFKRNFFIKVVYSAQY